MSSVSRIVCKLATKPIRWWERNRPYAMRSRYRRLPSLAVVPGDMRFIVLTTPRTLNEALWTAWSWYRFLRELPCRLLLVVDGELTRRQEAAAERLFPGVAIESAEWACNYVRPRIPGVQLFYEREPEGRKLAQILAWSDRGPLIFADCDVLAFQRPHEMLAAIEREVPCHFVDESHGEQDDRIAERAKQLGVEYVPKLSCGLFYLPQGSLPIRTAGQITATWRARKESSFSARTVLSFLLQKPDVVALPPERYVVGPCRQFGRESNLDDTSIAARYFTGPARQAMYTFGMPVLLRQSREWLNESGADTRRLAS